jgi:hypothetical protein
MTSILCKAGLPLAIALGLVGCAGDQATGPNNSRMFGLVSGPVPAAQPFVAQSRPAVRPAYPAIGVTPPTRSDRILDQDERKKLEADLKRYSGPPSAKSTPNPLAKRKKPLPTS